MPAFGIGPADDEEGSPTPASRRGGGDTGEERRPEKSTAVASRLIAAGIGQKAPKRTKEEREYDAAIKAQERKRRDMEREEEERRVAAREKAKRDSLSSMLQALKAKEPRKAGITERNKTSRNRS